MNSCVLISGLVSPSRATLAIWGSCAVSSFPTSTLPCAGQFQPHRGAAQLLDRLAVETLGLVRMADGNQGPHRPFTAGRVAARTEH